MDAHNVFGSFCLIGETIVTVRYIHDMLRGDIRPHAFSWFVWSFLSIIAALVAFVGRAYMGGVVLLAAGIENLVISVLAVKYGERHITRSDKTTFLAALSIIPIWVMTKEPLYAALLVTAIDWLAVWPTLRKTWTNPNEESAGLFVFSTLTVLFGVLSISPFSIASGLYPAATLFTNSLIVYIIVSRRHKRKEAAHVL